MDNRIKREGTDRIRLMDAIGWLETLGNCIPGDLNQQGVEMMKDMAADAADALRKGADKRGLILRSEAMAQIKAALPNPPEGLHSRNTCVWGTIKSTFVGAMWYPAAAQED